MFVRWLRSVAVLGAVAGIFCMARLSGAPQDADEDLESVLKDDAAVESPADAPADPADAVTEEAETPADDSADPAAEPDPAAGDDSLPGLEDPPTEAPGDVTPPADDASPPPDDASPPADDASPPADDAEPPAEDPPAEKEAAPARERPAAPPPRRAPARLAEPREPPARSSGEVLAPGEDIFERLGLTVEARREEAKELVRQAKQFRLQSDLVRAEGRLVEAKRLDPQNEEVDRLLAEVRLLLGDPRGAVKDLARALGDEQKVAREQARTEIHRLLNEGRQFEQTGEFSKAVDRYELAIESIRHAPLDLRLESELRDAQTALEAARRKAKEKEDEDRRRWEKTMAEQAFSDSQKSMLYLENQVRELRRKADAALADKDFDRSILYYERILTILPRDEVTLARLKRAKEDRHTYTMDRLLRSAAENYDLAILSIEESSVTYQRIFRYPDPKEWARISPKVVSIEEEIAASESPVEKEIKRKLEQPYEIGFQGETLSDALKQLQNLSGVNFILNKEGTEKATTQVNLARLPDLRLRNVLSLLLQSAGEDFSYTIKSGAVVIGPKTSLPVQKHLRFYEISDLIQVHPDFKAPPLALDELQGKQAAGAGAVNIDVGGDDAGAVVPLGGEKLVELIKKEIGEGGEAEEGVSILQGKLSALTSIENHMKLSKLLTQFRRATGVMVTVESRFLDIQDNFLEEIGVNFGSGNATFLPNNIPDIDGAGTSISPGWEWVNKDGDTNVRAGSIGNLSQPLGTRVNPFNLSSAGGGAYQLNVLKAERYQLEAILTGVGKEQEIRKLNSPRVTAFNGQIAHTLVVNQAAYIQDLEVNQTGVIPVINPVIDVLNSGSILEVRPTVSHDRKYVVLEIQPTLAEKLVSERAVLNLSGNFTVVPIELPVLSVTKIKTTVTVPDGGTVLVGGLKREIRNESQIGIPGLLDFPLINLIFGRKGTSTLRSNLFVLINAKVTIVHEEEANLFGA